MAALPEGMDDAALETTLFAHTPAPVVHHAPPDLAYIHQELKCKGVTLMLLWEEYSSAHPGATYGYSQFCLLYKTFRATLKRSMRQVGPRAMSCNGSSITARIPNMATVPVWAF